MNLLSIMAIGACVLLALNVGGNNSAAEMGPAFGSGIRSRLEAVMLIAIFSMLGAWFSGAHVVQTVGVDLIGSTPFKSDFRNVIVVLLSAASMIALANWFKLPVSTAHAMVGAVLGLGIFSVMYIGTTVNWHMTVHIVLWWLATPITSLVLSYVLGRYLYPPLSRLLTPASHSGGMANKVYRCFVTFCGCYMAYNAGSNSLAKAVAPIVGAGILPSSAAAILGGVCMSLGAYFVGHRLMHTVGKEITPLDPLKATMVELVCGTILLVASTSGIPISLAETVTCSVIGFGAAHSGIAHMARNKHIIRIYVLWPACPVYTSIAAFSGAWLIHRFG